MTITRLRFGPQHTTLSLPGQADVVLDVSVDHLALTVFRHTPPTPAELEQAIDEVEDALTATRLTHAERGELLSSESLLRRLPGLQEPDARLTLHEVEALFQQLAAASLGQPLAAKELPNDGHTSAALLVLRECMHHLGFSAVRVTHA